MFDNRSPTRLELTQPISVDKFLNSKLIKQSEIDSANLNNNSNIPEYEQQSITSQIEEYLEKIDTKMKNIQEQKIFLQNQLIIELKQLYQESLFDQRKIPVVYKIFSLFLSFYGFWRESENIIVSLSSKLSMKGNLDIYDFILDLLENKQEMSQILSCLYHHNNEEQKDQREIGSSDSIQFKEFLFITIIQTFNIRMNVISKQIFQWLVVHEKLNIIEILLENGRFSASQKQDHYLEMKKQEKKMLKWMHSYLIIKNKIYNNEIEFLLNLNDNQLQLLSSHYTEYIIKHECIPTTYLINRTLIKEAVCKQNVPLMSTMISLDRVVTLQILHSNRVLTQVKIFFQQPETFGIGLYFLKKMSQKHQRKTQSSDYLESILHLLERPQNDEVFASQLYHHCLHPLVCCLVISKILLKLSQSKNPYSSEMLKLAKFYLDRALLYRDTIFDAREMSIILFKPLFPSDKPLVKALRNEKYCSFFTSFFVHPCITYLLEQKWMSTYGYSRQLLSTLTPMAHIQKHAKIKNTTSKNKSLSFSTFQKSTNSSGSSSSKSNSFSFEHQKQNWIIFKDIEMSQLSKICKNNYFYQFIIYNKSVAVRTMFEFIFFLFIFISTIYILIKFVQNFNDFIVIDEDFKIMMFEHTVTSKFQQQIIDYKNTNPPPYKFDFEFNLNDPIDIFNTPPHQLCIVFLAQFSYGYQPFIDYYYKECIELMRTGVLFESTILETIYVCWLIFCIGGNVIQKQIYVYLIRKKTDLSIVDLIDLSLFMICAAFLITKSIFIPKGLTGNYSYDHFNYYTNVLKIETCIIVFLLWIRLFVFLIRSQKIGMLVKIIILFIKDLMQFIIILIVITVAFGAVNYVLFQNQLEMYRTFEKSFFNLIAGGFGAFDFKGQNGIQSFILIVFLIFVNVILLNLLIAILNTRYEKTMQQSEMEYSLVVYNDYMNLRFNSIYACMISLPPPLNILNFAFGIIALITKSRTWNRIALKIGYTIVILIPCSVVYIAFSLILIPISYIVFIHKVSLFAYSDNMMSARKRNNFYKCSISVFRILTWIAFGIPYLLLVFVFHDLPLFYKSAFVHNSNKYNFTCNPILDIRVIRFISQSSNYLHLSKSNVFNYLEFRSSLENKKVQKYKKTSIYNFAQSNYGKPQLINQINSGQKSPKKPKLQQVSNDEKQFAQALKRFGDFKLKSESDNIQLNNLMRAIKYSAIFFKKSKSTSYNLSKLLYIVRKRDQFTALLQQNSTNFFQNRSFSSYANLSANNLI